MRTFGYSCVPYRFIKRVVRCLSVEASAIPKQKKTIAVAMSGGIDSAVSALLLQDQGYDIVGVFMKNWDAADECGSQACDLDSDQKDMQEVCDRLGIPAYEVSRRISTFSQYVMCQITIFVGEFCKGILE